MLNNKKNVQKKAISDIVYERLYNQIVTGKLQPGERITELQVAQAEGVSQAPVREALKRLSEDRLVKLIPRSGCYICKITREEAGYLFEIRKRLEVMAMEYAFDRLDMAALKKLREEMDACQKLGEKKFIQRAIALDAKLHSLIAESSGSEDLQILIGNLRARIQLLRIREAGDYDAARNSLNSHILILDAMISGNKQLAVDCLTQHISQTQANVIRNCIWD